ncbi:hypothetical protein [Allofrancisella frigidaquae]|uniref:Uncharacterized protein n=1 Tax=Allofrancisella frigidaquae TaxID=1085644 RepID=A0A6M3HWD4_9GAMM|nr:hypothetical protein [Allofrancisella frigidaquae]QIV94562.1 hypothetical protein E3E15_03990 [Allofrancisella frigidaquae]
MKFRHAIYISFHGDMNGTGSETKKSYFYQKDKNLEREYTIKMHSDHKRKSLLKSTIPFVRINFPYFSNVHAKKLDIKRDKNNCEIAEELMAKELKNIQPYSRIYISAHSVSERSIQQLIKSPGHDLDYQSIPSSDIANVLSKYIPALSKKNLQIFLMIANVDFKKDDLGEITPMTKIFAQSLMEELHKNNFNRTSVVAYNNACKAIELTKNSKNKFKLNDISTIDRDRAFQKTADELHFKHGNKQSDNKIVFHNYSHTDKVEETGYRDFKKKYMSGFNDEYKRGLNKVLKSFKDFKHKERNEGEGKTKKYNQDHLPQMELTQSKFEVQTLKDFLLVFSLSEYVNNYEQKSFHGIKHHHGKIGYNRIMCFHDRIAAISEDDIRDANDKVTLENIANRIIVEIIDFAKQDREYRKFAGNSLFSRKINVNDNSGMTKILEGLQTFYKQMAGVVDNELVNESLQEFEDSLKFKYTNLSDKKERESILDALKKLDSWDFPNKCVNS